MQGFTGEIQQENLRKFRWYRKEYRKYQPNMGTLDSINKSGNYQILIYGGLWCSDTRRELPRMMKVLDVYGFKRQNLKIYFVDEEKHCLNCRATNPAR